MAPRTPLRQPARKRFASALAATAALALAFTGLTSTIAPAPRAEAAPAPAFDCTIPRFFAQAEDPIGTVKLSTGTYESDGSSKWTPLGPVRTGTDVYNAVAFNPHDDFLYGTLYGSTATNGRFVRIDRDGNLTNLGASSGALGNPTNMLWDSGEFDTAGTYYVANGYNGTSTIYKISGLSQVTSATSTPRPTRDSVTLSQSIRAADFTFIDGFLWAPNYGQSSTLYRIDINGKLGTPGAVRAFTLPTSIMPTNSYGSAFTMTNGNLALIATNGHMYQISIDNPGGTGAAGDPLPSFELISDVSAPANQRSNATNCASALPSSLTVVKTGPETVVVGETITWTITVTNDGPGITSGFVLNDSLPTGLRDVEVTSTDTACELSTTVANRVTCIGGLLPVHETATVTVSATAPDEPTALQNQAYAIGNEDPAPDDPVKVDTEVVRATIVDTSLDIEADGTVVTYDPVSQRGGGVTFAGGDFTYTPPVGFSGIDEFSYQTPGGTVTVIIYVRPTADPTARTTNVAQSVGIPVATFPDDLSAGSGLTFTSVGNATHGTVTSDGTTVTFTPEAGYAGIATFDYVVTDSANQTATNTVTITVLNVVTANDDTATTTAGTAVDIDVTDDDVTAATNRTLGDPSVGATTAKGGATSVVAGQVRYTPAAGFSGTDTFSYTVCDDSTPAVCSDADVTVTVNNVFTPTPGGAVLTPVTTPHNVDVTIDLDDIVTPEGTPLDKTKVDLVTDGVNGTVTVDSTTGAVTYEPDPGYTGDDEFTLEVCDTSVPVQCADVIVKVTVGANTVAAVDDSDTTPFETAVTVDVRDNDTSASGQGFAVPTITRQPAAGTGSAAVNANGDVVYTPADGFTGEAVLEYRVCDTSTPTPVCDTAEVTITVTNVFTPGTAVVDGISTPHNTPRTVDLDDIVTPEGMPLDETEVELVTDGDHGTVEIDPVTGEVTYTPNPGYTGDDEFEIEVCDTSAPVQCTTVTIEVTVGANTVAAVDDSDTTPFETAVTVDVRDNDTSASGQGFAVPTIIRQAVNGTVTEVAGELRYLPDDDFTGVDTFEYRVCDTSTPTPVCDTAEVTITVTNVFTPGTVVVDGISTPHNTPRTVDLDDIVTASGAPIDPTAVTEIDGPDHGTVDIDPLTGEVTYTPTPGYSGDDEFTLEVCDTSVPAQCTDLVIEVTVSPNTVAAADDSDTTEVETPVTVDVRDNDTTASGQPLAHPTVTSGPANGSTTVNADGDIVYTPDAGFSGEDTFDYQVCDTSSTPVCQPATVTITVQNVFVPGTPVTDGVDTKHGEPVTIPIDDVVTVPGAPLDPTTVTVVDQPDHGNVDVDPQTGELVYTPGTGFSGDDEFDIEVCDTSVPVQCATLTVTVHVAKAPALAGTGAEGVFATVATSICAALLGLLLMLGARRARRSRAAI